MNIKCQPCQVWTPVNHCRLFIAFTDAMTIITRPIDSRDSQPTKLCDTDINNNCL